MLTIPFNSETPCNQSQTLSDSPRNATVKPHPAEDSCSHFDRSGFYISCSHVQTLSVPSLRQQQLSQLRLLSAIRLQDGIMDSLDEMLLDLKNLEAESSSGETAFIPGFARINY